MAVKDDAPVNVVQRWSRIENYVDKNKKRLSTISLIIAVLVGGLVTYKFWYLPSQEEDAEVAIRHAQQYFTQDSIGKAIKGDGINPGFLDIADQYGSTAAGQLANYYLGICYYKQNNYKTALEYLDKFNANDVLVSANAKGVSGDAEMQLGNTDKAIEDYLSAAKSSDNTYTAPMYMKKAALAYESKGDYASALTIYQNIKSQYNKSTEAADIDKYIARAQTKAGK